MLVFDQMKKGDRPLWWLTVAVSMGVLILLSGLWYRQVYASSQYVESQKTQSIRLVRYPALRGKILDRHGVPLAVNRPSYNVNLYLEELSSQFQEAYSITKAREDNLRSLKPDFTNSPAVQPGWLHRLWHRNTAVKAKWTQEEKQALGKKVRFNVASNLVFQLGVRMRRPLILDEKKFNEHYANRLVVPLPVMEDLNPEQVAIFHEMPNKSPGLYLDIQPLREYPQRKLAAHLIGYLQHSEKVISSEDTETELEDSLPGLPDYEGTVGLEGAFDNDLRGRSGIKSVQVNNLGYRQSETILLAAEPGSNVVTTIDMRVQVAAVHAFEEHLADEKGAVIVMDPRNGDILAMVSYPPYDPNSFIPRMPLETWTHLMDTNFNIMLNRATFGEYAPGSIFKIVVGLACLEAGTLDPAEVFKTKGYFQYNARSKPIKDTAPPGNYDFRRALMQSSNEYFITNGLKAGLGPIMDMANRFCLGQKTLVPLRQEETGFIPSEDWLKKMKSKGTPFRNGDLCFISIGQGYLTVTPIQMALMTCAVANGGKVLWPRLIDRIEQQVSPEAGPRIFPVAPIRSELGVSSRNLETVRQAMLADVEDHDGSGKEAAVAGLRISGKTGTAEVFPGHDVRKTKNTWFVSFAPYDHPKYVVLVMVESGGRSGGKTCAPVAQRIYKALLEMEAKG